MLVLVERMLKDDVGLSDSCIMALPYIGGDVVVKALANHWRWGSGEFRSSAAPISMREILWLAPPCSISLNKCGRGGEGDDGGQGNQRR